MDFSEIAGSDEGPGWSGLIVMAVVLAFPALVLGTAIAAAVWLVASAKRRRNPPPKDTMVLRLDLKSGTWQEHREVR